MLIIGENVNATIPKVKEAILAKDEAFLIDLAKRQEAAGAGLIDINVGTGEGTAEDEASDMKWLVGLVMDAVGCKLSIDSDNPVVLEAGLDAAGERAGMINSTKGSDKDLLGVMPLAKKYSLPIVGLAMDKKGIPKDAATRVQIAGKILDAAASEGVPQSNVYIDPLVMPISTDNAQGMVTLQTLAGLKETYPEAKTVLAVSNASFGLPKRAIINGAFVSIAAYLGVDALLINPMNSRLKGMILASNVVLGRDRHCRKYSRAVRTGQI